MNTILLPTDFSENSYNAIRYALNLLEFEGRRFVLINAYQSLKAGVAMIVSIEDLLREESEEELQEMLERIRNDFPSDELDIRTISRHGDLVSVLNDLAKEFRTNLIAMGTHGTTGLKGVIMGSNSLSVVKNIPLPVLVVPHGVYFNGLNKIGLGWDKQKMLNKGVLEPVIALAREYDAEVDIVHVCVEKHAVLDRKGRLRPDFDYIFRNVEHHFKTVETGNFETGIRFFIEENNIDLMVVIAREHDFFNRLLHKSHSSQLVKQALTPLLVLPDN